MVIFFSLLGRAEVGGGGGFFGDGEGEQCFVGEGNNESGNGLVGFFSVFRSSSNFSLSLVKALNLLPPGSLLHITSILVFS